MTENNQLKEKIDRLIKELPEKTVRDYRVDYLGRLALRAGAFGRHGCSACHKIETDLNHWVAVLQKNSIIPEEQNRAFFEFISISTSHMMKEHRLVTSRQYLVSVLPICFIFGLLIGLVLGDLGIGALCGIAAGLLFGIIMDVRAQRRNRVI